MSGDRLCRRPRTRDGVSLIEVIVAVTLIAVTTLGFGAFIAQFSAAVGRAGLQAAAGELVADRLEEVKAAPRYEAIDTLYAGTELSLPGYPGFTRRTLVRHVGGRPPDVYDYRVVTVIVDGGGLRAPVKKTTVISFF